MSPIRTATKLLGLAPDELVAITERAHRCGQTPARFIREAAPGIIPHARRGAADDARIDAVLHAILDVAHRLR